MLAASYEPERDRDKIEKMPKFLNIAKQHQAIK